MSDPIKVVFQGLGPIGLGTAKLVYEDPRFEIVGAIEIDERYIGKDLGALLNGNGSSENRDIGVEVTDDAEKVFEETKPDVVLLATTSILDEEFINSIEVAVRNGVNVVSPCEELFYPEFIDDQKNTSYAADIDTLAKENGVRVLGRGVNPGLLMDTYPLQVFRASGIKVDDLESMVVYRHDDTSLRRISLLDKIGVGLDPGEFNEKNARGEAGHVGLRMSAAYLADKIGLKGYKLGFGRRPVVASRPFKPLYSPELDSDVVKGLHETCDVIVDGQSVISLDLRLYDGAEKKNAVVINGKETDYSGMVDGDEATYRVLKDAILHVAEEGKPGLNTISYVPDPMELLNVRGKLKVIRALEENPDIEYGFQGPFRDSFPESEGDGISQYAFYWVAPKKGLYNPSDLQEFMMGLVPDIKPLNSKIFSRTNEKLMLGYLNFSEVIARERVVGTSITTLVDADMVGPEGYESGECVVPVDGITELKRSTDLEVYPSPAIAKAVKKGEITLLNGGIRISDIERYQPGMWGRYIRGEIVFDREDLTNGD